MKILCVEKRLCGCCMEEHDVQKVLISETNIFKGISVDYDAVYFYCDSTDEFYADEDMVSSNDIAMKNSYRKKSGLLTTDDIIAIRSMYCISQSDLCLLLGWGGKTITRYESHQVQDHAHDTILKKLADDPEWFLTLLKSAKDSISETSYLKYYLAGIKLYENDYDLYLKKVIFSKYARFNDNMELSGERELQLGTITDAVRYFANSSLVTELYKTKLMRMLWYSDALSYKRRKHAITGMVYQALPTGVVPIAHETIFDMSGINYKEIEIGNGSVYQFLPTKDKTYPNLTLGDMEILDTVIQRFGDSSRDDIVNAMHKEEAYSETSPKDIISFKYVTNLSLG